MNELILKKFAALLRICFGFIFLWTFLDKTFGWGFATAADKSWLAGNSPTLGFLKFGTQGPFAQIFQGMAGNVVVDWMFMLGMLLVGLALILGVSMKIASVSGSLMMLFIYLSMIPPEQNPIVDQHIIYILSLLLLGFGLNEHMFSIHGWWRNLLLVKKYPILK